MSAVVLQRGLCDLQVCVPAEWTDAQAVEFANADTPSGLESGWALRTSDDPAQRGAPIRVQCAQRADHVHIMLTC